MFLSLLIPAGVAVVAVVAAAGVAVVVAADVVKMPKMATTSLPLMSTSPSVSPIMAWAVEEGLVAAAVVAVEVVGTMTVTMEPAVAMKA